MSHLRPLCLLLAGWLLPLGMYAQADEKPFGTVQYALPDSFMTCLRTGQMGDSLLTWFNSLTGYSLDGAYRVLVADLDDDPDLEAAALLGGDPMFAYTHLGIIDQQDGQWVLVYLVPVSHHYDGVVVHLIDCPAQRLICLRLVDERGSGVFMDAWYGFRLIDGTVHPCMRVLHKSQIYGWGLSLNQQILGDFECSGDWLQVTYTYHFFPGSVLEGDVSWESHDELAFARGEAYYYLVWDSAAYEYRPEFDKAAMTAAQWMAMETFGADSAFVAGFGEELAEIQQKGTPQMRKIVTQYLRQVQATGKAVPPSGEVIQQGAAGDLRFYGPAQEPRRRKRRSRS
ncbi:MAG: hypothetical protein SF053_17180 [Bacteroidia bacterium]|nr:hypothetical protein [Bacteroidia bacterium]